MSYNVENPMVISPCAKLYDYSKWYDEENGYCGDDTEPEEILPVFFGIDTRGLTADEEYDLIDALAALSWKEDDCWSYSNSSEKWFTVNPIETPLTDEEKGFYGYIEVEGYARELLYDKLVKLIEDYNVAFVEVKDFGNKAI